MLHLEYKSYLAATINRFNGMPPYLCSFSGNGRFNSPKWIVGHSTFISYDLIGRAFGMANDMPSGYIKLFGYDSSKGDALAYPDSRSLVSEYLHAGRKVFRHLKNNLDLSALIGRKSYYNSFENDLHMIIHGISDLAYHCGQLGIIQARGVH